ncbi:hypothetical protein [Nonomuraea sp. NPDC050643]|uniref:hypothetical protein n=1 Tax=Nonomuraea sp. NPDC050643 TaxID=3155660 RepID=UPI00340B91E8
MNEDDRLPGPDLQAAIEDGIRDFPFWNYGLDMVDPNDKNAEWVPDLAKKVIEHIANRAVERASQQSGEASR